MALRPRSGEVEAPSAPFAPISMLVTLRSIVRSDVGSEIEESDLCVVRDDASPNTSSLRVKVCLEDASGASPPDTASSGTTTMSEGRGSGPPVAPSAATCVRRWMARIRIGFVRDGLIEHVDGEHHSDQLPWEAGPSRSSPSKYNTHQGPLPSLFLLDVNH